MPSISGNIGAGPSYGITTSVPTIFTLHAQSLIINSSQLGFIKAAHAGIDASEATLQDTKEQVEEDAVISYLSLCEAEERNTVLEQEYGICSKADNSPSGASVCGCKYGT